MTEARTGSTGWRAAAAIAPATAAALALTTGWAVAHQPESSAISASPLTPQVASPLDPALDHADVRLHREALAAQGRVEHLTRSLHRLRNRTRALRAAPLPVFATGVSGGGSTAGSTGRGGGGGGNVSVPAPPVAPAPATHTTTKAS